MDATQTKPTPDEAKADRPNVRGGEVEPTMEDILASIRRIIAEEDEPDFKAKARANAVDAVTVDAGAGDAGAGGAGVQSPTKPEKRAESKPSKMTGRPAALESPALAPHADLEARIDWGALDAMLDQAERDVGLTPSGSVEAMIRAQDAPKTDALKAGAQPTDKIAQKTADKASEAAKAQNSGKVDPVILNRVKDAVLAESARHVQAKPVDAEIGSGAAAAVVAAPGMTPPLMPAPEIGQAQAQKTETVVLSGEKKEPIIEMPAAEPAIAPVVASAEPSELLLDLSQAITMPPVAASAVPGPRLVVTPVQRGAASTPSSVHPSSSGSASIGPASSVKDLVRRTVAASGQPVGTPEAVLREGDKLTPAKTEEAVARVFAEAMDPNSDAARRIYAQIRVTEDLDSESIEGLVRSILRPMLRDWLEENLPSVVERLVKAEIERVSAHGARLARTQKATDARIGD